LHASSACCFFVSVLVEFLVKAVLILMRCYISKCRAAQSEAVSHPQPTSGSGKVWLAPQWVMGSGRNSIWCILSLKIWLLVRASLSVGPENSYAGVGTTFLWNFWKPGNVGVKAQSEGKVRNLCSGGNFLVAA